MALLFSLLVAVFGVFASQNAIHALELPYDPTIYKQILSGAPWYSYCELPWLTFFDGSYFAKFNELANEFNVRISDIYQFHAILESNMPNLPYPNEYNIMYTTALELKKEMDRRGIYSLPSPPPCYKYDQSPIYPTPVLAKRSPLVIDPAPYPMPTYPTDQPYPMPTYPVDPYNPYPVDYDLSLAYKNLYVMLDQQMPILPSSTYNNILNSVLLNTPLQYQSEIDDVTTQLTTNMRYILGMAQRRIPPLY